MVNATTLTRVKLHLGDTGTANDTLLNQMIESVSREIEAYLHYPLLAAQRTELYDIKLNDALIFLRVIPVTTVDEVKLGPSDWDFASLTALVADRDYRLGRNGELYLAWRSPAYGFQKAQIKYTAGYGASDSAVATAAGDIALAAEIQVAEDWRRKDNPATISIPGPSGSKQLDSPHRFLPRVRELLDTHVRILV